MAHNGDTSKTASEYFLGLIETDHKFSSIFCTQWDQETVTFPLEDPFSHTGCTWEITGVVSKMTGLLK